MTWAGWIDLLTTVVMGVCVGIAWVSVRRMRQTVQAVTEQALAAMEVLDLMEQAHDPGRDVQDRLARALEARIVMTEGHAVQHSETRRAMAQLAAAGVIEDIKRANLELVTREEP